MSKYTQGQIRQAQDLAVEFGHLNKNIQSLPDLYSAAPDMLEALKHAKKRLGILLGQDSIALVRINEAIAKAEGK